MPNIIGKLFVKLDKIEKLNEEKKIHDSDKNEELFTIEGAAELLKLSVATIYTKVCKNEIPVNKQGKRLHFCRIHRCA